MKTAERENPNRRPQCVANRADGAASQYRSCSIMWAAKQENFQPAEKCFFLTSPFIEPTGSYPASAAGLVREVGLWNVISGLLQTDARTKLPPTGRAISPLGCRTTMKATHSCNARRMLASRPFKS